MSDYLINNQTVINDDKKYVWHHLTQHQAFEESDPMIIVEGNGMRVKDIHGVEYLDGASGGIWTVNVGYGRESMARVIYEQLQVMPYYAGAAGTIPGAKFAKELISVLPSLDRVYYSNSGSEANEKAYKMVRQRAHFYNNGKKHKIIYRDRDYHGTTIATLSSTGQFERKNQYGPFVKGFIEIPHCCCYRCPFNKIYGECEIECATALEDTILEQGPENIGALVLEPITAGGGVIVPPKEYFPIVTATCKKYDVLLHIDEVVCGVGRTGKWFGHQHFDVKPDIVTMAKGVASGYAGISVTATTNKLFDLFKTEPNERLSYFRDISTFAGCTAGPVAALENIKIIKEENLLDNVTKVGDYLLGKLHELADKHSCIGDVRGKGLLAGIELVEDRKSKQPVDESIMLQIAAACLKDKVLISRTNRSFQGFNNTLIFSPAFICTTTDIDEILRAVDRALSDHV